MQHPSAAVPLQLFKSNERSDSFKMWATGGGIQDLIDIHMDHDAVPRAEVHEKVSDRHGFLLSNMQSVFEISETSLKV